MAEVNLTELAEERTHRAEMIHHYELLLRLLSRRSHTLVWA